MNISPVLLSTKKLIEIKTGASYTDSDLMLDAILEQQRRHFLHVKIMLWAIFIMSVAILVSSIYAK